jgi:hypothetical protein
VPKKSESSIINEKTVVDFTHVLDQQGVETRLTDPALMLARRAGFFERGDED